MCYVENDFDGIIKQSNITMRTADTVISDITLYKLHVKPFGVFCVYTFPENEYL